MYSLSQRSKQNGAAECQHNRHERSGQTKPTERDAEKHGGACQKNQQSASPAMAEQQWYRLRPGHSVSGDISIVEDQRIDGQDQKDPEKNQPFLLSR